jgi:hypothetical protein
MRIRNTGWINFEFDFRSEFKPIGENTLVELFDGEKKTGQNSYETFPVTLA